MTGLVGLAGLGLTLPACDLDDKSIGDTGAAADTGGSDGGDATEGADDGLNCTLIGCTDQLTITLLHGSELAAGQWEVSIVPTGGGSGTVCEFEMVEAGVLGAGDCGIQVEPNRTVLAAGTNYGAVDVTVTRDGAVQGSTSETVAYQTVAPNGIECGPVCEQGDVDVVLADPAAPSCAELEAGYQVDFAMAQACTDAVECGQTLTWGSCGCTRAPVVRLDANIGPLQSLWDTGVEQECAFTQGGSTCDCPEVDGFACIDNLCSWNYL